jgi:hypothetical protein
MVEPQNGRVFLNWNLFESQSHFESVGGETSQ